MPLKIGKYIACRRSVMGVKSQDAFFSILCKRSHLVSLFLKWEMIMLLLILLFALPLIIIFIIPRCKTIEKTLHPPGPPRLPFIGNLHQFDTTNTHVYLWRLSKRYGPIMAMKLGSVPTLVISSARLAKEVMKTNDAIFASRPTLKGQQKLSYNGLDMVFSPLNDYLKEMRKICVVHLFSLKQAQSFRPIREDEVLRVVGRISSLASSAHLINLSEIMMSLASSVICRVAFGKRYDEEGSESRKFDELLHEAQALFASFFISDYFPSLGWIDKLTGMISRLEKNFKDLDSFYQELIEEHLSPNRPQSMKGDIIDILLQLRGERSSSLDLTLDHIKAVLMNIIVAGTDTSAAATVWAMTALMKKPQVMKKVQAEIRGLVGKKSVVDEDDIQKLPYLKAIVKETLRLYPPAPLLVPRETMERCILDGYEIQPKTLVFVNAWSIGRDSDYWENPDEFLPERFLNSMIDFKGQDFGFIPFGSGRRICPGFSMGVATVELVLANFLYSFDWELPPGMEKDDIDTNCLPGITMHKKNPLCLVAKSFV